MTVRKPSKTAAPRKTSHRCLKSCKFHAPMKAKMARRAARHAKWTASQVAMGRTVF